VIADADPNNHSSSNTEVHIAPDPEKTDNQSEHVDIDLDAGSGSVCSPSSPNLSSDPSFWSELSPSDIDYWLAKGPASCRNRKANYERSKRLRDPNHPN